MVVVWILKQLLFFTMSSDCSLLVLFALPIRVGDHVIAFNGFICKFWRASFSRCSLFPLNLKCFKTGRIPPTKITTASIHIVLDEVKRLTEPVPEWPEQTVPGESNPKTSWRTLAALGFTPQPSATSASGQSWKQTSIILSSKLHDSITVHLKIMGNFEGGITCGNCILNNETNLVLAFWNDGNLNF